MSDESKRLKAEKTLKQKVAFAQLELNRLKSIEKSEQKKVETRLKIILGAEVAKAMNCSIEEVDKELVMGILLSVPQLNDIERIKYIKAGRWFLAQLDGRQK
ncbi:conjugal transfer protein TraD [Salmonella enterica]|uniref:conjugal transfer protein TraD n=1 Tax=Salmonella enterica TaxID=28901 RepID=UPI002ACEC78D|nr:conjugal transfer protein TraD [Salmonella enterica]WQG01053.1 conjugal transfer protein TraD [Salmonella enterica subsp. enterica serovar Abortusovis]WQG05462.1 conjugal transfer protein TraD [Salmonella enterica subsp. enterica serovar Abortusovis]WQG09924.1 conjugal transfer protein TraD [Salmonella enterica subsp. enterica serovar Abortusovis]WQG14425.1 conjugal transfer protein TraD [Salmonella enterica subsp. enterica serovar Abortusovis]HCT0247754.1 conjugal transfer protein TraD [Sa